MRCNRIKLSSTSKSAIKLGVCLLIVYIVLGIGYVLYSINTKDSNAESYNVLIQWDGGDIKYLEDTGVLYYTHNGITEELHDSNGNLVVIEEGD